jgi:5-methylcytosine-specific restriction endonuclease McrA
MKDPYEAYREILRNWDGRCILCGEKFENMESITMEHLVPKSKGGCGRDNYAPSHFNCNQLRGDLSLIETITLINRRKEKMGLRAFLEWCNKSVPNRRTAREKEKKAKKAAARALAEAIPSPAE